MRCGCWQLRVMNKSKPTVITHSESASLFATFRFFALITRIVRDPTTKKENKDNVFYALDRYVLAYYCIETTLTIEAL